MPESVMEISSNKPKSEELILSVVVPTHGRLDLTMRCMGALYNNTQSPFNLIVVDDSDDETPAYFTRIMKERKNITYIHSDVPYKEGNQIFNIGLKAATTPFVAMVMNSVRVEPDWEIVALQLMRANPQLAVIGFKCILPDRTIESAGIRMVKWLPCDLGRGLPSHRLSTVYESDAVQWAFALLRKEAVTPLEEGVFNGFKGWDDIDNCFVVKKNGWKVFYDGLGVGYHEPRSTRGDDGAEAAKLNAENGERFYKRWGLWEEFNAQAPTKTIHATPVGARVM